MSYYELDSTSLFEQQGTVDSFMCYEEKTDALATSKKMHKDAKRYEAYHAIIIDYSSHVFKDNLLYVDEIECS